MLGKYITDWREKNVKETFRGEKKRAKNLLGGKPNGRWEYNIKMCSKKEMGDIVDWIYLAQTLLSEGRMYFEFCKLLRTSYQAEQLYVF
jgi:hypothetical protein